MSVMDVREVADARSIPARGDDPEKHGDEWARPDEILRWSSIFGPEDLTLFISRFNELN